MRLDLIPENPLSASDRPIRIRENAGALGVAQPWLWRGVRSDGAVRRAARSPGTPGGCPTPRSGADQFLGGSVAVHPLAVLGDHAKVALGLLL